MQAGAAELVLLDEGDGQARVARPQRAGVAAAAAAEDHHVVGHCSLLASTRRPCTVHPSTSAPIARTVAWCPCFERMRRSPKGTTRQAVSADKKHLIEFAKGHTGVEAFVEPPTAVTTTTVVFVASTGEWTRRRAPDARAAHELAERARGPELRRGGRRLSPAHARLERAAEDRRRRAAHGAGPGLAGPSGECPGPVPSLTAREVAVLGASIKSAVEAEIELYPGSRLEELVGGPRQTKRRSTNDTIRPPPTCGPLPSWPYLRFISK